MYTSFGVPSTSTMISFVRTLKTGTVLLFRTEVFYVISTLSFQLAALVKSILVNCLVRYTFLRTRLKFCLLYSRNLVYILLVNCANRYPYWPGA